MDKRKILHAALLILTSSNLLAQTCTFNSGGSEWWNNGASWSCGSEPTNNSEDAIIASGAIWASSSTFYSGNSSVFNGDITVQNGATFLVVDDITVNGTVTVNNGGRLEFWNAGDNAGRGSLTMGSGSSLVLDVGATVTSWCGSTPSCADDPNPEGGTITINGSTIYNPGSGGVADPYIEADGSVNDGSTTLPIELYSFEGHSNHNGVVIEWATSYEFNNENFVLEHSLDGRSWQTIGSEKGAGMSNEILHYRFDHTNPNFGNNYYRLTQVDYDGASETFDPIKIIYHGTDMFTVYPNPSVDCKLNVWIPEEGYIKVHDVSGQLVRQWWATQSRTLLNLSPSIYFVSFESGGQKNVQRIIVK